MPKITKRVVDAAAPKAGRYIVWDTELRGFGLLVLTSGVRSFIYDYRNPQGRQRRITIGKFGDWTADAARKKADEYHRARKDGRDPLGERQTARAELTVGEVLDSYLESEKFLEKAASTRAIDTGRIERHLRPLLGKQYAEQLTAEPVRRAFRKIRDGATAGRIKSGKKRGLARVTGGEGTARMAVRLLRAALSWAMAEALLPKLPKNPCEGLDLGADGERETILEDVDGYKRLFATLDIMEAEKRLRRPVADAIRVIALTGARRGEIAGLRWEHVELQKGRLVLPPAQHKTGRKTGKDRVITLPALAQAIIDRQDRGAPDDLVFKPAKGSGALNLSKPWRNVRAEAELPAGIGLHGLRHSVGSHMAMEGASAAAIMQALGHRQMTTSQRYIHWADKKRQEVAEKAASVALAGMAAATGEAAAAVVDLPKRVR